MKKMRRGGTAVKQIAKLLGRSTDTVTKHTSLAYTKTIKKNLKPKGKPPAYVRTEEGYSAMKKIYDQLLRESKGKSEVSPEMVKMRMGLSCATKTISRAFWDHGVYFRPLYEKPDLSKEDKTARKEWGDANKHRSPAQWNKHIHADLDNKTFPVFINGKGRDLAARRTVRGAYRTRRRVFTAGYVKPKDPKALKQNTGAKSVMVSCALGAGKVLMWHYVEGRWNADAAEKMYKGPLRAALQKAYPDVRGPWRVLEDNDPTGYKSKRGLAAKAEVGIQTLDLPRRSPDLNPLDFSFWAQLNKRMRAQEKSWHSSRRETRAQYLARLRKTALSTPSKYIVSIIGALAGRTRQLCNAKGGHFAEGGSS